MISGLLGSSSTHHDVRRGRRGRGRCEPRPEAAARRHKLGFEWPGDIMMESDNLNTAVTAAAAPHGVRAGPTVAQAGSLVQDRDRRRRARARRRDCRR